MKVIGIGERGQYLVEISHTEIEKVLDKYYDKLKRLEVGSELNLGAGYDYRQSIQSACRQMVDATRQFEGSQKTLMAFALMVSGLPEPEQEPAA